MANVSNMWKKIDILTKIQLKYFKSRLVPRKQIVMQQMLYNYVLHSIKLTLNVIWLNKIKIFYSSI